MALRKECCCDANLRERRNNECCADNRPTTARPAMESSYRVTYDRENHREHSVFQKEGVHLVILIPCVNTAVRSIHFFFPTTRASVCKIRGNKGGLYQ